MRYFRVEVETFRRSEWFGHIYETHETIEAASRELLEAAVRSHIEEVHGEHRFEILWLS